MLKENKKTGIPVAKIVVSLMFFLFIVHVAFAQQHYLSSLRAGKEYPLYTTYAAAMERSAFILDEAYRFRYDQENSGADLLTDSGGDIGFAFKEGKKYVYRVADMFAPPVITSSYPDMVRFEFFPFEGIKVSAWFVVHSSTAAILDLSVENQKTGEAEIEVSTFVRQGKRPFQHAKISGANVYFEHLEQPDQWTIEHKVPYTDSVRNVFICSAGRQRAALSGEKEDLFPTATKTLLPKAAILSYQTLLKLKRGQKKSVRVVRNCGTVKVPYQSLALAARALLNTDLTTYQHANERLFSRLHPPQFADPDKEALFWSCNSMMRQVFYPPEGKCKYNYYVFSREPTWGWGHGGQVFHESISMLSYLYLDPEGAMNSQRVFSERQYPNGYINYRTGPYLDEVIEYGGKLTTSAPWYAWLNWEIYQHTRDRKFLQEMYESSKKLFRFIVQNRDTDADGLCEWNGEAILESVRDSKVAVWDQVGYPSNFESLDLNCLLVMEAKSLEKMAAELGHKADAGIWKSDYTNRASLINKTFWDEENGFYYQVDKNSHRFTFKKENDLKRDEIIGFLPLWAGIASKEQARRLVVKLTDPRQFWRPYGVPSLSAADPYYDPKGYWNGPVWVQWDFLIMRGLLDYGYRAQAKELVDNVVKGMVQVLKKDHDLWEFYSPDHPWGGYHKTYIWAGIINRMMIETEKIK
ncbi:amylo-alpha-1,6-glucosidase [Arcticibacter tournemirensis]